MGRALTYDQRQFCDYVEQIYSTTGNLPTSEKTAEILVVPIQAVKRFWNDERVRSELTLRGIDLSPGRSKGVLTAKQLQLANLLLNVLDRRGIKSKLAECGVTEKQYQAWLSDRAFKEYITKRAEQLFDASKADAYMSLIDVVKGGDVSALKLYFEMTGVYNPKVEHTVKIEVVIMQIIDILQRHIKDPAILEAIAVDIEMLDGTPMHVPTPSLPQGIF